MIGELENIRENITKKNGDLFYVNTLINAINRQFLNYKSKPLSFRYITQKIEEFKSLLSDKEF